MLLKIEQAKELVYAPNLDLTRFLPILIGFIDWTSAWFSVGPV